MTNPPMGSNSGRKVITQRSANVKRELIAVGRFCLAVALPFFGACLPMKANASDICFKASGAEIVTQAARLSGGSRPLNAVAVSKRGNGQFGLDGARVLIFDSECRLVFQQRFPKATEARFEAMALGDLPVLVLTALSPGISGDGYQHVVLSYRSKITPLTTLRFDHSNMGGFALGRVGPHGTLGFVLWDAVWAGQEAHYDFHRYEISLWIWQNGRVSRANHRVTKDKFIPDDAQLLSKIGIASADLTKQDDFKITNTAREKALAIDQ